MKDLSARMSVPPLATDALINNGCLAVQWANDHRRPPGTRSGTGRRNHYALRLSDRAGGLERPSSPRPARHAAGDPRTGVGGRR